MSLLSEVWVTPWGMNKADKAVAFNGENLKVKNLTNLITSSL